MKTAGGTMKGHLKALCVYVYWEPHVSTPLSPVWCLLGEPLHLVLITEMWWGRVAAHHLKRLWLETWKSSSQRGEDVLKPAETKGPAPEPPALKPWFGDKG